jgi:hypothetical protein
MVGDSQQHAGSKNLNLGCRSLGMLIPQMPVDAHRESAAVSMTKPSAYSREVHAAFNADGCEKVTQAVMRHFLDP